MATTAAPTGPTGPSLSRAAHDLANAADTLSRRLATAKLAPEAAHRVERALTEARHALAVAHTNAGTGGAR